MRLPFNLWSIAGVPSTRALLGFLITAPLSVCVPEVIGALAVWIPNPRKKCGGKKNYAHGNGSESVLQICVRAVVASHGVEAVRLVSKKSDYADFNIAEDNRA